MAASYKQQQHQQNYYYSPSMPLSTHSNGVVNPVLNGIGNTVSSINTPNATPSAGISNNTAVNSSNGGAAVNETLTSPVSITSAVLTGAGNAGVNPGSTPTMPTLMKEQGDIDEKKPK
ncbi:hypothetical protein NADFUDRAFT_83499 [Nadsonia fulvescens var. elongata DSM 6958]|uniref:Uncharacterized protein n=1 Tax=Nadsonia fulvescens var. elongata DSM 6958 TaxID=857566 RepID=A0A1E3PI38_9ASCO|nr:hypothetical protein NADFUDRAFT_83499 [Nadsonia fulvescens var. elongata DSM 6958]